MVGMIAPQNAQGEARVEPQQKSGNDYKQCRQAGRYEIGRVIQPRGELAKVEVTFRAITDHGVQCVDGFVGHCQRNPAEKKIEQRGDDAVAGILSQRFQAGAQNFILVQSRGIPPNDMGKLLSCLNEITRSQRGFNVGDGVKQPAGG